MQQDEFLRRFQDGMNEAVEKGLDDSKEKVQASFRSCGIAWKKMNETQRKCRSGFHRMSDEAVVEYRGRLENIANSWMVATVATLDHQSKEVIAQIAATAEEKLQGSYLRGIRKVWRYAAGTVAADCGWV